MHKKIHNRKNLKRLRQKLRNNATRSEKVLWQVLRLRGLGGRKFRRQHSIGPYVVDFYCPEESMIIEVDGTIHDIPEVKARDEKRENYLRKKIRKIIRIEAGDVFMNIDEVIQKIEASFSESKST